MALISFLIYNETEQKGTRAYVEGEVLMNVGWSCAGLALALSSLPLKKLTNYEAKITRHTIEDPAWNGNRRLRIALISDFHDGDGIWSGRALARLVRKEQVDLIFLAGDFFEPGRDGFEALTFLDGVCQWRPVYYVSGNHDEGMADFEALKNDISRFWGVHVLDNRKIRVRVHGTWIEIFGVRDQTAYANEDLWLYDIQQILRKDVASSHEEYRMLLCHRPEHTALFDQLNKNIVFCGHAHGGQWRLKNQGIFAPGQGLFPRYTKGIYKRGKRAPYHFVVGSGFAVDPMVPRFNNQPELVIVDIV